ncbi:MAG TPA: glycosyltransferase family 9 protein [Burkholderiales bacterium]|nr:glycosyltransferase family 9 protein [Burkholderiales bacterium]
MAVDAARTPRFLIIRRDNVGDLVCTTPLLESMRARLPHAWLGALVTTYNAEVLARNPALDEIFIYEKLKHRTGGLIAHVRSRLGQMSRLRQQKLDCVLVPAPAPQSLRIARSLRPGEVLAAPVKFPAGMHEVERTFALGRPLGMSGAPGPLRIFPDPKEVRELGQRIGAGPFTIVHISARRPAQRWPLERYAALAAQLSKQGPVLLLWAPGSKDNPGHPGDDEAAAEILRRAASRAVIPLPTPDLKTLIAALSLAGRVICPDGGAMHLAAALGKPVVALFGDSPVQRWRPWGVPYRVVRPESRDLADLPIEPVLEAFRALA